MLSSLRLRLTAVFTFLTILVLTAAIGTAFFFTKNQYLQETMRRFDTGVNNIAEQLRLGTFIKGDVISQHEAQMQSEIYIEDNGTSLQYSKQKNNSAFHLQLAQAAKAAALSEGFDLSFAHRREVSRRYTFSFDEKEFYTAAIHLPKANGKYIVLLQMRPKNADNAYITGLFLKYMLLWALCAATLCVTSFILCGFALKPTRLALKRQAEFTAAASHELRGPAAVISANLSALQNKRIPEHKAQEFLQAANDEAKRLARLAQELTTLACGDIGGKRELNDEINPDTICIELYEKYYSLCKENGHEISVELPKGQSKNIFSDKECLAQLLGIFVLNAVQHTKSGTKIVISLSQNARHTVFAISDNGEGIPECDRPFIFERFYKADKSRSNKTNFGLGLSIAKTLADEMHIKIQLCEAPGGGTSFIVTI